MCLFVYFTLCFDDSDCDGSKYVLDNQTDRIAMGRICGSQFTHVLILIVIIYQHDLFLVDGRSCLYLSGFISARDIYAV